MIKISLHLNSLIAICLIALLASFCLEYFWHLVPCVLCQIQRLTIALMLMLALLQRAFFVSKKVFWSCFLSFGLMLIFAMILSGRHVWLQSLPLGASPTNCLPSLAVLWQWLPWAEVFSRVLQGDALCHIVTWRFWGLSLAAWLALLYFALLLYWVWLVVKIKKHAAYIHSVASRI